MCLHHDQEITIQTEEREKEKEKETDLNWERDGARARESGRMREIEIVSKL